MDSQGSTSGSKAEAIAPGFPPTPRQESESIMSLQISREHSAMTSDVFVAWEKLRFLYNAILLVSFYYIVIPLATVILGPIFIAPPNWLSPAGTLILWNVCFCVGPVAEGYLCVCGVPRRFSRFVIFCLVTIIMIGVNWNLFVHPDTD